jgi:protein gp37
MGADSKIEWTGRTWNPVTGCDRVSPGCDHCYAQTMAQRLKAMGSARYQNDGDQRTSGPGFGLTLHWDKVTEPLRWQSPQTVFVNSMSDLFHDRVPLDFIQAVFDVMRRTPRHTYQILTKRSTRLARLANELPWPPNVWMGVSVENQDYVLRAERLLRVPASVRFLSVEPLIGPVNLSSVLDGLQWVIAGGESGKDCRPCDIAWLRSIRDQCNAVSVPFFLKQLGGFPDKRGHERALIDGRLWREMP